MMPCLQCDQPMHREPWVFDSPFSANHGVYMENAWVCVCGYATLDGQDMPEYMALCKELETISAMSRLVPGMPVSAGE
jgi:hypothetical protein